MSERRLYELINPSDAITFRATPDEAAVMAVIFHASMLFVKDAVTGAEPVVEDFEATRKAIWADPERQASYAAAYRSFLVGSRSERELFEEAVKRMTPDEATAYRAAYHDRRRTSMNDICARMWDAGDKIAAHVHTEKVVAT